MSGETRIETARVDHSGIGKQASGIRETARTPSVPAPDRPGAGLLTPSQEVRALRGSPQTTSSTAERPALNRSDRGSNPRWSTNQESGVSDQGSGIRKADAWKCSRSIHDVMPAKAASSTHRAQCGMRAVPHTEDGDYWVARSSRAMTMEVRKAVLSDH